jgi:hypothetical protein
LLLAARQETRLAVAQFVNAWKVLRDVICVVSQAAVAEAEMLGDSEIKKHAAAFSDVRHT